MPAPTEWFGLDDRQPEAGFVGKNVIGAFWFTTSRELAPHNHAAFGKINLLANPIHQVPFVSRGQGRSDELGANVTLAKSFFICRQHGQNGSGIRAPKILIPEL